MFHIVERITFLFKRILFLYYMSLNHISLLPFRHLVVLIAIFLCHLHQNVNSISPTLIKVDIKYDSWLYPIQNACTSWGKKRIIPDFTIVMPRDEAYLNHPMQITPIYYLVFCRKPLLNGQAS